jgi:hypothetical protein
VPVFAAVVAWGFVKVLARRDFGPARARVVEALLIFGPIVGCLAAQFLVTFSGNSVEADRVILAPLKVWSLYSPNVPASILLGIAFPLVTAMLYPRETWADRRTLLAWAVLAVAIFQFALLAEEKQLAAGNFAWGCYFADYVLFVLASALLVKKPMSWRFALATTVLSLHTVAGLLYVGSYLMDPVRASCPD